MSIASQGKISLTSSPVGLCGVRTEWKTADVWLRRTVELKAVPAGEVFLRIHHDEDAEVYVNGVLAAKVGGYGTDYAEVPLTPEGRKAVKAGTNTIAVADGSPRGLYRTVHVRRRGRQHSQTCVGVRDDGR